MSPIPHLVGMVHLLPLPGSPRFGGSVSDVVARAVSDASTLRHAGFPAVIVENYGDSPFFADSVPAETIAGVTAAVTAVRQAVDDLVIGVNVLRNDALAGLGVAAATGAEFIRVNVLTGIMYADQGPVVGNAAEVLRTRARVAPWAEIWADVMVKHATPPPGLDIARAASDTLERGLADAVVVSGPGTGQEPDLTDLERVRAVVPSGRVAVGSGASMENLSLLAKVADTVIVGSATKTDGDANNPVDVHRAERFVELAKETDLL